MPAEIIRQAFFIGILGIEIRNLYELSTSLCGFRLFLPQTLSKTYHVSTG